MRDWQLSEYEKLKEEQVVRIRSRTDTINFNLASIGLVATVASSVQEVRIAFLIAPVITTVFGYNYLQNNDKIQSISRYLISSYPSAFGWERTSKHMRLSRRFHKVAALVFDLCTFCVPAFVFPIAWLLSSANQPAVLVWAAAGGIALGALLSVMMVLSSPALVMGPAGTRVPLLRKRSG